MILLSSQKSIPFWGELTLWLYFPAKTLSHSEGTWLSDHNFQQKFYSLLRGPDYVIIFSSQNSIPFWGELTLWLYFPVKILSHSEWTWLCDYTFQSKIYPILRGPDYVIILSSQKLSHSEVIWLCDHNFQPNIYPILRGPDYVIILSSQKSIPFRGDLTMWLYFPVKNLSHSEGTWLCDHNFQPKIYPILRGTDSVIILSSQKSIPFWGDLTMWS